MSETPVTDAYLARIKADGVDEFVEKCREKSKQAVSSEIYHICNALPCCTPKKNPVYYK
ncbi:hypothetical protein ACXH32_001844 [Klebsiella pneumoniae]